MNASQFYRRQKILKEVGEEGQEKLSASRVLIIGAGGLGHPVASYLAASGVGTIGICDFDKVETSNLHRQVLFHPQHRDENKAQVLTRIIENQNPFIRVFCIEERLSLDNGARILDEFDIVVDCSDNFETKFLLHDLCFVLNKNLIQASIYQFEGQIQAFYYGKGVKDDGCLRCLWPKTPHAHCVGNCAESGVLGAIAGMVGTLEAVEVLKCILEMEMIPHRTTILIDALSFETQRISWPKNSQCSFCARPKTLSELADEQYKSITDYELKNPIWSDFHVVDIREKDEAHWHKQSHPDFIKTLEHIPQSSFDINLIKHQPKTLLVCATGKRSFQLAKKLRIEGYNNVYSLVGGESGTKHNA